MEFESTNSVAGLRLLPARSRGAVSKGNIMTSTTTPFLASNALRAGEAFTHNNLSAKWIENTYYIWSYQTLIAKASRVHDEGESWMQLETFDSSEYSRTTSRHQRLIWNTLEPNDVEIRADEAVERMFRNI